MTDDKISEQDIIIVRGNEVNISTLEKTIIGTKGLVTCVAFILYNEKNKKAIVDYISVDILLSEKRLYDLCFRIYKIIYQNQLIDECFNLIIIEGAEKSQYEQDSNQLEVLKNIDFKTYSIIEILEIILKQLDFLKIITVNKNEFSKEDYQIVDEFGNDIYQEGRTMSKQFAFDASIGKFVTNKVIFNKIFPKEYYENTHHAR